MTAWHAFFLGVIQGLTEFLPVSSSGHLALAQHFLNLHNIPHYFLFSLVCHLGTLLAIFCMFFPRIKESIWNYPTRLQNILIGTLPLIPLAFFLPILKPLFSYPQLLGPCFLISAFCIFISTQKRFQLSFSFPTPWKAPLFIGISQAIAIFPGISRSGMTISAARILGWSPIQATHFSFLLAIPAILGATVLEIWHVWKDSSTIYQLYDFTPFVIAFCTSFVIGYFSLGLLIRLVIQEKWNYFAWYCLVLGILLIFYFTF
jgi:undecaprenyl-diphosphatase